MKKDRYFVGDLAAHFNVSRDTIRLYDKLGLIHPTEVGENRYRVYSREDFICMDYIMRLRKLGMPLKEIKSLVNSSSIERAEAVMQVQEKVLGEKIEELKSLQNMASDYRKSFGNAISNMGEITIEESPVFILQIVEDSLSQSMDNFEKLATEYVPKFTFLVKAETFSNEDAWGDLVDPRDRSSFSDYAVTLIDDGMFSKKMDLKARGFTVVPSHKSVHAILKAHTNKDYSDFYRIRDYILDNGYELCADAMYRVISVRNYDITYYDFWAPIK